MRYSAGLGANCGREAWNQVVGLAEVKSACRALTSAARGDRIGCEELAERRCVDHFKAAAIAALDMIERTSTEGEDAVRRTGQAHRPRLALARTVGPLPCLNRRGSPRRPRLLAGLRTPTHYPHHQPLTHGLKMFCKFCSQIS